jgi:alanine racemase
VEHDLEPMVFDPEVVEILAREAERRGKGAGVYLKVDTGMGRLGIPHGDVSTFLEKIRPLGNLTVMGLTSHLSSADESNEGFTRLQIASFRQAIEKGRAIGFALPKNNLANSAGTLAYRESWFDMIRPGIMLYGGSPSPGFRSPVPLKPVMRFSGRVLQVRRLPPHTPVSYGRTYTTDQERRIAVTSAGYGDGLPRSLSNRGHVLIREDAAPIVGTVCMNQTLCDVTHIEGVLPGDEVVFLGTQGRQTITGDDIARQAQTISYEVFCSIGQRNIKEYA